MCMTCVSKSDTGDFSVVWRSDGAVVHVVMGSEVETKFKSSTTYVIFTDLYTS